MTYVAYLFLLQTPHERTLRLLYHRPFCVHVCLRMRRVQLLFGPSFVANYVIRDCDVTIFLLLLFSKHNGSSPSVQYQQHSVYSPRKIYL